MAAPRQIPELSTIEFDGSKSITEYSKALRSLGRDLAVELEASGQELEAVLAAQKGHPLLMGLDVRRKAKRVAKRLHRAQELATGVAREAVALHAQYRKEFVDVVRPQKRPARAFDFEDE